MKSPLQAVYHACVPLLDRYAFVVSAGLLLVPLLLVAKVTYRLIELPRIGYAKTVNARLRQQQVALAGPEKSNP